MKELREALDTIEPTARQALDLAYFGGLDIHAISEILNRPVPDLRVLLRDTLLGLSAATRTEENARTSR